MRAIVSVDPASDHLDEASLGRLSAAVQDWAEHSDKPIILMDGVSVELFDDDWNFVTRSPYWKATEALSEAIEVRPDRRPLVLSAAAALASLATFVLVALQ